MLAPDIMNSIKRWRFSLLLAIILCTLVFEPMIFGPRGARWIFDLVYTLLLGFAVYAISGRQRYKYGLIAVGILAMLTTWTHYVVPAAWTTSALVVYHLAGIGFLLMVVLVTINGLFSAEEINLDLIVGTFAGYLLLGTAWAFIYSLIHLTSAESFSISENLGTFVQAPEARFSIFLYYSFVTLTTLGYGDLTPVSQTARVWTWLEAAVGQFYMATLVAGIIGLLINSSGKQEQSRLKDLLAPRRRRRAEESDRA